MKRIKSLRKELQEKYAGIPNKQVRPGVYVKSFGYKYITLLSTWETTHYIKCCYNCFLGGDWDCRHI